MSPTIRPRPPFSTRHAFALAFDLAVRRDPLHSLILPLVLRAPWLLALLVLPPPRSSDEPGRVVLVSSLALVGLSVTWLLVDAMLRFRARSVFNTPPDRKPAPALDGYAHAWNRLGWLYATELVRNAALTFAFGFLVLPGIFLAYRLTFATEAVVLDEPHLAAAFQRSWRYSQGRFERWLEMIAVSVTLILGIYFVAAVVSLALGQGSVSTLAVAATVLSLGILPIVQYAWTFFYLRLAEVDVPGIEVGPAYATHATTAGAWSGGDPARLVLLEPTHAQAAPAGAGATDPPEEDRTA